jgi:hypothetical protein
VNLAKNKLKAQRALGIKKSRFGFMWICVWKCVLSIRTCIHIDKLTLI